MRRWVAVFAALLFSTSTSLIATSSIASADTAPTAVVVGSLNEVSYTLPGSGAGINSIKCPSSGNCVEVGINRPGDVGTLNYESFIRTQIGGEWQPALFVTSSPNLPNLVQLWRGPKHYNGVGPEMDQRLHSR